jgi:hypothetical protein
VSGSPSLLSLALAGPFEAPLIAQPSWASPLAPARNVLGRERLVALPSHTHPIPHPHSLALDVDGVRCAASLRTAVAVTSNYVTSSVSGDAQPPICEDDHKSTHFGQAYSRVRRFVMGARDELAKERDPRSFMAPSTAVRRRTSSIVDSVRRVCAVFDRDGSRRKEWRSPDGASGNRDADLRGIVGIVSLGVQRKWRRRRPTLWGWRSTGR